MNKRTGRLCGNTAVLQENNINFYDGSKCFPMKRWGRVRSLCFFIHDIHKKCCINGYKFLCIQLYYKKMEKSRIFMQITLAFMGGE